MFEKIGQVAENMATRVSMSRRGFLSRLGQTALGAAGALSGLLLLPGQSRAGTQTCPYCDCHAKDLCPEKCKKLNLCPDYITCWNLCFSPPA